MCESADGGKADMTATESAYHPEPSGVPPYLPIAEHGLIGDLRTVALVGTNGTIDWYCCPRFDAPSVFASILDADRGGSFELAAGRAGADQAVLLPRHQRADHPVLRRRRGRRDPGLHADRRRLARGRPAPADPPGAVRPRHRCRSARGWRPASTTGRQPHTVQPARQGRAVFESPRSALALTASVPLETDGQDVWSRVQARTRASPRCSPSTGSATTSAPRSARSPRRRSEFTATVALLAALAVRLPLPRPVAGDGAPLRAHAEAAHLRADRRDRGRADDQPARADRRRAQLGLPLRLDPRRRVLRVRAAQAGLHRGGRGVHGLPVRARQPLDDGGPAGPLQIMYGIDGRTRPARDASWPTSRATGAPPRYASATPPPTSSSWTSTGPSSTPSTSTTSGASPSPATTGTQCRTLVDWVCEQLGPARRGHLGDPRRAQELPVLAADVLGGDRTGHADGHPAAACPPTCRRWRRVPRRDLPADHAARLVGPSGRRSSSTTTTTCSTPRC